MNKAICSVSVAPVRETPSEKAEMVTQMLFGESCDILDEQKQWTKIQMHFDGYEGWINSNQISPISDEDFARRKTGILTKIFEVCDSPDGKILLSIGSELESETQNALNNQNISETARQFLNVPYLWSGRSFFGIDCSGFVQLVYKVQGISLSRDAYQQAETGTVLAFVEESEAGDLAFFENEEGKIVHVGIMLENQEIIHAFGKVRIDSLDSTGIFNKELNRHTHKLRFVKRIIGEN
ncbi:MAG: C40 family peptidase [Bergeyella sp.]